MNIDINRPTVIALGYDFSERAESAARAANKLAEHFDAKIVAGTAVPGHIDAEIRKELEAEARKNGGDKVDLYDVEIAMEGARRSLEKKLPELGIDLDRCTLETGAAKPAVFVADLADRREADLIVVGATGLGRVERWVIGSTSERLIHNGRWPVLVVRGERPIERIVCCTDLSEASQAALEWGLLMQEAYGAELHLLHVGELQPELENASYFSLGGAGALYRGRIEKEARLRFEAFIDELDIADKVAGAHFRMGSPDEHILALTETLNADLVCIGSQGRRGLAELLVGNTANRVIHRLERHVLIAKPDSFGLHAPANV
jgi:nucleotide-binding universal stress UspA family protein